MIKHKPFVVAEISANHCGSISIAKKLIQSAKKNGADAVKLQTFTESGMTINSNKKRFTIGNGLWKGFTYWELYKKAKTPHSWHKELFKFARQNKIICFSTPFDLNSLELLENLKCSIYKMTIQRSPKVSLSMYQWWCKEFPCLIDFTVASRSYCESIVWAFIPSADKHF